MGLAGTGFYGPRLTCLPAQPSSAAAPSAEDGAAEFDLFEAVCQEQVEAGYDALRAEGLPVGIKIKVSMTIGDPKDEGRMNPNGANGKGLKYFGAGSTLADDMLSTWATAAGNQDCG